MLVCLKEFTDQVGGQSSVSGGSYECPGPHSRGSLVVQWLRLCASTRKVANYRATSCNSQSTVLSNNAFGV